MPIYKTKIKKDGQQKYRVVVNYMDINGNYKKIERVCYGLAESKQLEFKLSNDIKHDAPNKKFTIRTLFEDYLSNVQFEIRETSFAKKKGIINTNVFPYIENVRLDKLNIKILNQWKLNLAKRDISIRTKRNAYGELRAMLNFAVKMGYLESNPLNKIDNFRDAYETHAQEKLHFYTQDQFLKFIAAAKNHAESTNNYDYFVFFNTAYYTGMRKGEINALKWSDLNDGVISVRRSIAQKLHGGDRETPPKNKSSYRTLQIPKPLTDIFDEHLQRQRKLFAFNDDFRICGADKVLRDTTLENRNKLYAQIADVPKIRIHDFRHSHASLLANAGINIQEIARRLGHEKIEMTWNTYSHLYPQAEEQAIEVLNKIKL